MNTRNLWIASLSGALLTTFVSNIPFIGFVNCLLCAGFWGSAIFAVWFYRRLSGSLTPRQAVIIGALTGLCAGVIGFLLSFVGLSGGQGILNSYSQFMPSNDTQSLKDLPAWAGIAFNLIGVVFNLAFGTLGGWLGGLIFKPRVKPEEMGNP
jgi:hypothetical protein